MLNYTKHPTDSDSLSPESFFTMIINVSSQVNCHLYSSVFKKEEEEKKNVLHGILCLCLGSRRVTLCSLMLVSIKFT